MRSILAMFLILAACGGGAKAIPAPAGDGGTGDGSLADAETSCGDMCLAGDGYAATKEIGDTAPVPEECVFESACAVPGTQCKQQCSCTTTMAFNCTCVNGKWGGCESCSFNCPDAYKPIADADADAGPTDAVDAAADVTAFACLPQYEGSVPGAHVDLSKTPCVFSISQNPNYFKLPFQVVVETSEMLTPGRNLGQCAPPDNWMYGGVGTWLRIEGKVGGQEQVWCQCDTGPCFFMGGANDDKWVATTPGVYDAQISWDGKNFQGASDTQQVPGKAFPPGEYFFRVQTHGKRKKADGTTEPYAATASLKILLVP